MLEALPAGMTDPVALAALGDRRLQASLGSNVRTAQYVIAETGPRAAVFESAGKLASWVGICPGQQESAGVSVSTRSAKGNWMLRRTLSQMAWAAVASKGSEAQRRFQAWRPRLGTQKAIWAVAHYQLRVIWKVLHDDVRYRDAESACPAGPCQTSDERTAQTGLHRLDHAALYSRHARSVRVFSSVLPRFWSTQMWGLLIWRGQPEQLVKRPDLRRNVVLRHAPGGAEGAAAPRYLPAWFPTAPVLLPAVMQSFALPSPPTAGPRAFGLQRLDRRGLSGLLVHH